MCVFTKDLKQLIADLETTDDEAAVIRRYADTFIAKDKVRREFSSDFEPAVLTCLKVCTGVGKVREKRESGQRSHT